MVVIKDYTTKVPLQMTGDLTGVCWGADTSEISKNLKRALDCFESGHGRVEEFPDVYVVIEGYSSKALRELYTHIGGGPTRLQASTRYIDYEKGFDVVVPPSVSSNNEAMEVWCKAISDIKSAMSGLKALNVPKEDYTNLLPLAYQSKMVWKVNLRTLVNFMNKRLCTRAYWEIRNLAKELKAALSDYSDEWKTICDLLFIPSCLAQGYCTESKSCGMVKSKQEVLNKN